MKSFYSYKSAGIFQSQAEIDNWPEYGFTSLTRRPGDMKYVDVNKDGRVNSDDRVIHGSIEPKYIFGFNLGATYKNFDVLAFFQGAGEVYRYFSEGIGGLSTSTSKPNKLWLDSWTPENTNAKYPRLATPDNNFNTTESDFWIQNASYLRLKDLQIGYTFPRPILHKLGASRLRIYYSGQNLLTITGLMKGWDPEAPAGRGNGFPQTVVNSFGINLSF